MLYRVNRADVAVEVSEHGRAWRCFRRDGPQGIGVGVAAFGRLPAGADPEARSESHDVPEVHYVISGRGVLYEEGATMVLSEGDAVITEPGRRHALWSNSDEPLVTVYAAASARALGLALSPPPP